MTTEQSEYPALCLLCCQKLLTLPFWFILWNYTTRVDLSGPMSEVATRAGGTFVLQCYQ